MEILALAVLAFVALGVQQHQHAKQTRELFDMLAVIQTDFAKTCEKAIAAVYTRSAKDEAEGEAIKARTAADIEVLKAEIAKGVPSEYNEAVPRGLIKTPDGRTLMEVL